MIISETPLGTEDPDENAISDIALEALEAELPALTVLRDFASRTARVRWFTNLGEPLDEDCLDVITLYLEGLGLPEASPAPLLDWRDAADAAEDEADEQDRDEEVVEIHRVVQALGLRDLRDHENERQPERQLIR